MLSSIHEIICSSAFGGGGGTRLLERLLVAMWTCGIVHGNAIGVGKDFVVIGKAAQHRLCGGASTNTQQTTFLVHYICT